MCKHDDGCNVPEGECSGACMTTEKKKTTRIRMVEYGSGRVVYYPESFNTIEGIWESLPVNYCLGSVIVCTESRERAEEAIHDALGNSIVSECCVAFPSGQNMTQQTSSDTLDQLCERYPAVKSLREENERLNSLAKEYFEKMNEWRQGLFGLVRDRAGHGVSFRSAVVG